MKSIRSKTLLYALVLLAPLAAQASNTTHEKQHSHARDSHRVQTHANHQHRNIYRDTNDNRPTVSVSEPSSLALLGAGMVGLFLARRFKKPTAE